MDGYTAKYDLEKMLREGAESTLLDDRTSWDYLWKAAIQWVKKTHCLTTTQSITTVASTAEYDLEPDFLQLYLTDTYNRYFIKYRPTGTTTDYFILFRPYDAVIYGNVTTAVTLPSNFSLKDRATAGTNLTGTATAGSTGSTLINSTAPFATVKPGDTIYNTTDVSAGIITGYTSTSTITAPLFGGTDDSWASSDAYVIVPQGRKQLVLDPPPVNSGDAITVYYLKRPDPVYSDYGQYPFDSQYALGIVSYAAWLYKYREEKPQQGDAFYKYYDAQVREAIRDTNRSLQRMGYTVVKSKRAYSDRSYR